MYAAAYRADNDRVLGRCPQKNRARRNGNYSKNLAIQNIVRFLHI